MAARAGSAAFALALTAAGAAIAANPARPQPPVRPAELSPAPQPAQPSIVTPAGADNGAGEPRLPGACLARLMAIPGNRVVAADQRLASPSDPSCAVAEPVVVTALAVRKLAGPGTIGFDPPVTLSCAMTSRLSTWLDLAVQPLARGHFNREIASLRVGGGHECRRRNRATSGPISEHATGQALDIFAFVAEGVPALSVSVERPSGLDQNRFLDAVRQSACGAFMTAIGPGADAAHANHLHVDIQPRRAASSRFCQ